MNKQSQLDPESEEMAKVLADLSIMVDTWYDELRRPGSLDEGDPEWDEACELVVRLAADVKTLKEILSRYYDGCRDCLDLASLGVQCVPCMNVDRMEQGLAPYHPLPRERAKTYGVALADLQRLVNKAGGHCEICDDPLESPFIDHNHATGEVRGVLCPRCNTALGQFRDDPDLLEAAAAYLNDRGHYAHLHREAE